MLKTLSYSYGTCSVDRFSPQREDITSATPMVNVILSFEEGLKLNLFLQNRLIDISKFKKNNKEGRREAINLTIHLEANQVLVNPGKLNDPQRPTRAPRTKRKP